MKNFQKLRGEGGVENARQQKVCSAFFSHLLHAPDALSEPHKSRGSSFLISSRPGLEIELTLSQQTRKHFLISSFSAISAPAPLLANAHRQISNRNTPGFRKLAIA
jgi:hypothetical protein